MANILVVDDSAMARHQIKNELIAQGHSVSEASDGQKGYDALMAGEYGLVICDVNMPVMDGVTMLEKIHSEKGNIPTTFVVTAEHSEALRDRGKAIGVRAWIIKPVNFANLKAAIEKLGL